MPSFLIILSPPDRLLASPQEEMAAVMVTPAHPMLIFQIATKNKKLSLYRVRKKSIDFWRFF